MQIFYFSSPLILQKISISVTGQEAAQYNYDERSVFVEHDGSGGKHIRTGHLSILEKNDEAGPMRMFSKMGGLMPNGNGW